MAEVIPQEKVRDLVRAACSAAAADDLTEAMCLLAEAWDELFNRPGSAVRRFISFSRTLGSPVPETELRQALTLPRQPGVSWPDTRPVRKELVRLGKAVRELQGGLRLMALGIDSRQFDRFEMLTPYIAHDMDGHTERHFPPNYDPAADEFDYCRQFVVTVSLRLAELDLHAAVPSWMGRQ